MHTIKMVLPPDGEDYGFPKPVPTFNTRNEFRKWAFLQGYPQHLIDDGQLDYCKYIEMEYEVDEYSTTKD
jgi:hypothetical protein